MTHPARWWHPEAGGAVRCELCPHGCRLTEGKRGPCGVREARAGALVSLVYGAASGFAADPVEKKPLYHFLPGSKIFSFGTVGCPLSCRFCQNWFLSQDADLAGLTAGQTPEEIALDAVEARCRSVAFTYNEPAAFAEFALDTAAACRVWGLRPVAVTSGYFQPAAAREFFGAMDAANVDLKAITDRFYRDLCGGRLAPVLDTLRTIRHETSCWLEITTLLVPGENDSDQEIRDLSRWILTELGPEVPLHFSAFHPDHRMRDRGPTEPSAVLRARALALEAGLKFVYTGNIRDLAGGTTVCPGCGKDLVVRDGFRTVLADRLGSDGICPGCGRRIPGVF